MATRKKGRTRAASTPTTSAQLSTNPEDLLLAAMQSGDPSKTGRFLVTFKEDATEAGVEHLESVSGMRMASARDFTNQEAVVEATGDADAVVFPEIGVALVSSEAAVSRGMTAEASIAEDSPVQSVDPEYFMFANSVNAADYMKGVLRMAQMISADLSGAVESVEEIELEPTVLGATWGLLACKVPPSTRDGNGIKVAVLDTGFDLGHPEFAGRSFTTRSFVGQPVQDLHGHGTHTAGTACGPKSPPGPFQRYGIGFRTQIFIGKVLTNSGFGTQAQILAGINWAIANKCPVISMSLGAAIPPQPSYIAAGAAALANGCLIVAAAGNDSNRPGVIRPAGAPANSPTIMSVAALDAALRPAIFSNGGKIDIAGPGVNTFSSWPRPTLHNTISGTSMATPHVAGCAALWAQTSAALRGVALRAKLIATARHLPFPASDVGAGLVQAPA
ncbi:MAG TPA: S8 family serine peptidase [Pyrinomonadaceae bacterium]|nr:S8 family serine peptidase [Pyrinomonadaceae bacterium]